MTMLSVVEKYVQRTVDRLQAAGFAPIQIECAVDRLKPGVAGAAYQLDKRIVISKDYLHEHPYEVQEETIPHEVCHIYQMVYFRFAKQAHGPEFRHLMRLIGCNGSTKHNMVLSKGPTRRTNRKVRYVYVSAVTKREILLTRTKHTQQQNWLDFMGTEEGLPASMFTFRGEALTYTGTIKVIK